MRISNLSEALSQNDVEDIVLSPKGLSYYKGGRWHGPIMCTDCQHIQLHKFSRHIAEQAGTSLGITQPSVDAFLETSTDENFRAHVAITPLVADSPEITLRRLPKLKTHQLNAFSSSQKNISTIKQFSEKGRSILVSGTTGCGKTTFLCTLMNFIPNNCRTLVLEDSPELPLPNALSTKLLTRKNRFGATQGITWDLKHLVFESLRMRPDRIILGECRGGEAYGIAQALHTGHGGIMTTIHAGSCELALERFEQLARSESPHKQQSFKELWDLVIQLRQNSDGSREIDHILINK